MDIIKITNEILKQEGSTYTDLSEDRGGATKYGITQKTLSFIYNQPVSKLEVKNLTFNKARKILIEYYYKRPNIDKLPVKLQPTVYDMNVHSGRNSIKILQKTANSLYNNPKEILIIDGYIGEYTFNLVKKLYSKYKEDFNNLYNINRRDYYFNIVKNDNSQKIFIVTKNGLKGGWIKRVERFLPKDLQLSLKDFTKEIKKVS